MDKPSKVLEIKKKFYKELFYKYYELYEREFIKNLFYCIYLDDDDNLYDYLYQKYLFKKISLINPVFNEYRKNYKK